MSWSLNARADVREIGGVLRAEVDRNVHRIGTPYGEAEYAALTSAVAAATQVATSGAHGTNGVAVSLSGHTDAEGRHGTTSIVVSTVELDPPAIGPVEGRSDDRFRSDLEDFMPDEPIGQTDTPAFLAAQAEVASVERERADDEQARARREEQLKLERQAAETGTIPGADIVIGPERRPNSPVVAAQAAVDAPAHDHGDSPNEAFLEHLGEPDVEPAKPTGAELLAQPAPGAEGTVADPATPSEITVDGGVPVSDLDNGDDVDDEGEVTKTQLQDLLREHELPVTGTKAELVARLHEAGVPVVGPSNGS